MSPTNLNLIIVFIAQGAFVALSAGHQCASQVADDLVSLLQSTASVSQGLNQKEEEKVLGTYQEKLNNGNDVKVRVAAESTQKRQAHCCCTHANSLNQKQCDDESIVLVKKMQLDGKFYHSFAPKHAIERPTVFFENRCCKYKDKECKRLFQGFDARFVVPASDAEFTVPLSTENCENAWQQVPDENAGAVAEQEDMIPKTAAARRQAGQEDHNEIYAKAEQHVAAIARRDAAGGEVAPPINGAEVHREIEQRAANNHRNTMSNALTPAQNAYMNKILQAWDTKEGRSWFRKLVDGARQQLALGHQSLTELTQEQYEAVENKVREQIMNAETEGNKQQKNAQQTYKNQIGGASAKNKNDLSGMSDDEVEKLFGRVMADFGF